MPGNTTMLWSIAANLVFEAGGPGYSQCKKSEELGVWDAGRCSLTEILHLCHGVEGVREGEASTVQAAERKHYREDQLLYPNTKTHRKTIFHSTTKIRPWASQNPPMALVPATASVHDLSPPHSPTTLPFICSAPATSLSAFLEYSSPAPAFRVFTLAFLSA